MEAAREKQQSLLNIIKQLKQEFTKATKSLAMGMRARSETTLPGVGEDTEKKIRRGTIMGGGGIKKTLQGGGGNK